MSPAAPADPPTAPGNPPDAEPRRGQASRPGFLSPALIALGLAVVAGAAWLGFPAWLARLNGPAPHALFGLDQIAASWTLVVVGLALAALSLALGRWPLLGAALAWAGSVASLAKIWINPYHALEGFVTIQADDPVHTPFWVGSLALLAVALGCALASRGLRAYLARGESPILAGLGWFVALPLAAVAGLVYTCRDLDYDYHLPVLFLSLPAGLALLVAAFRKRPSGWGITTVALLAAAVLIAKPALLPAIGPYGEQELTESGAQVSWFLPGVGALIVLLVGLLAGGAARWWKRRRARPRAPKPARGERIIEMTWRCSSCGRENLGRHLSCQGCGNPKEADERYQMPASTGVAPTVVDPALLALATAAPNWHCAFCGSDQRAADGRCANCGAGASGPAGAAPQAGPSSAPRQALPFTAVLPGTAVVALSVLLGLVAGIPSWRARFAPVTARVVAASWKTSARLERKVTERREGFEEARPSDATAVRKEGRREHHRETVCVQFGTEDYLERVEDGTKTETYTEEEECGETCTRGSGRSCEEVCTDRGTGFASCRTVCTGSDRECRPKYCRRTHTRQVPKYKSVTRTRSVCKRSEEQVREQDWFSWDAWVWRADAPVRAEGQGHPVRWPELAPATDPNRERIVREGEYHVELVGDDGPTFVFLPRDEAEYNRLVPGARFEMVSGTDGLRPNLPQ